MFRLCATYHVIAFCVLSCLIIVLLDVGQHANEKFNYYHCNSSNYYYYYYHHHQHRYAAAATATTTSAAVVVVVVVVLLLLPGITTTAAATTTLLLLLLLLLPPPYYTPFLSQNFRWSPVLPECMVYLLTLSITHITQHQKIGRLENNELKTDVEGSGCSPIYLRRLAGVKKQTNKDSIWIVGLSAEMGSQNFQNIK
jgi:hypothetical protein